MGLTNSPYDTGRVAKRIKTFILGDPRDRDNVFRWIKLLENYPGSPNYDPSKPWIARLRYDETLACVVVDYVDDYRGTGPTEEEAWQVSSTIGKRSSYYRSQDAGRKRRAPANENIGCRLSTI